MCRRHCPTQLENNISVLTILGEKLASLQVFERLMINHPVLGGDMLYELWHAYFS